MRALIDTSVWFDLGSDYRNQPLISALEELLREGRLALIVPTIIIDEFERNRGRVEEQARRGFQSHFRMVRDAVARFSDNDHRQPTIAALNELDHYLRSRANVAADSMSRIHALLTSQPPLPLSGCVKQRVTDRALAGLAPFHRDKNNAADAVLIESYREILEQDGSSPVAFVTHNFMDFSDPGGDRRNPHPDLATTFDGERSSYWLSLLDFIRSFEPDLLDEHVEEFDYANEPRRLSEILEAEHLLFRQIWYNRHMNLRAKVEAGEIRVLHGRDHQGPSRPDEILDIIWDGALRAARRTEEEVGAENLGPWNDFEWGMLNGKLSALRWVLGDEWDMLDT